MNAANKGKNMTKPNNLSRRGLLQTSLLAGAAAAAATAAPARQMPPSQGPDAPYNPHPAKRLGQPMEGPDTPKLTTYMEDLLSDQEAIQIKQLGIDWIDTQAVPEQPWGMDYLQPRVDALTKHDMHIGIMMIRWSYNRGVDPKMNLIVRGLPGRDEEIGKIKQTIVNMGKLGIPVLEWNFYNHRAEDGYQTVPGRGGAGMTEFKYDRMKDLPPLPADGAPQSYEDTWKNIGYFLREVIPVAEKNNVVMSVHPNDPPAPDEPRLGPGAQQLQRLEAAGGDGELALQLHDLGLRRHPRAGRRPAGGGQLAGLAQPHRPGAFPQCRACASRARTIPRSSRTMATTTCSRS